MTPPVEWHDNEPTFPDFLQPRKLTAEEAVARIEGVLKAARIDVAIGGERRGRAWMIATFPDGAEFDGNIDTIVSDGLRNGR